MQIVQVSDLHIGGLFKQNAFDDIVNEIVSRGLARRDKGREK